MLKNNEIANKCIKYDNNQYQTRGLYYEAGFSLSELTSGKTRGFRSYNAGSLFSGLDLHGNLC